MKLKFINLIKLFISLSNHRELGLRIDDILVYFNFSKFKFEPCLYINNYIITLLYKPKIAKKGIKQRI